MTLKISPTLIAVHLTRTPVLYWRVIKNHQLYFVVVGYYHSLIVSIKVCSEASATTGAVSVRSTRAPICQR